MKGCQPDLFAKTNCSTHLTELIHKALLCTSVHSPAKKAHMITLCSADRQKHIYDGLHVAHQRIPGL